jgi:ketosteroid isomerase-like protein
MSAPIIHWVPIAEFLAMQAMEDLYSRYGAALRERDVAAFGGMLAPDFRWIELDGSVASREGVLQETERLFRSAEGDIELRTRLIAVSVSEQTRSVRAVKELFIGETSVSVEDVEEAWRMQDGKWTLAETRVCGG